TKFHGKSRTRSKAPRTQFAAKFPCRCRRRRHMSADGDIFNFFKTKQKRQNRQKRPSGVVHYDSLDGVGHMLAGVHAGLEIVVHLAPGDDLDGVGAGLVQRAHAGQKEPVALLFQVVDLDDLLVQTAGVLEVGQLLDQHLDLLAALDHLARHLQRVGADGLDVVAVDALQNVLDLVDHIVDVARERQNVLALDRGDERLDQHRSEEHTSELQSRFDLVCRLLLEKKKKNYTKVLR